MLNSPPLEDFGCGEMITEATHRHTPELVSEVYFRQQHRSSKAIGQGQSLREQTPLLHEHVQPFNGDVRS